MRGMSRARGGKRSARRVGSADRPERPVCRGVGTKPQPERSITTPRRPASIGRRRRATPTGPLRRPKTVTRRRRPSLRHRVLSAAERGTRTSSRRRPIFFRPRGASSTAFATTAEAYYRDEPAPAPPAAQLPAYAAAARDDDYEAGEPGTSREEAYPADDYHDDAPSPRRRSGLVVVMAVLGLVVVGTAGAFGYRAMFGGSDAADASADHQSKQRSEQDRAGLRRAQAEQFSQTDVANTGAAEKLVSREEQPVNMEPPKPRPRVWSRLFRSSPGRARLRPA